MNTKIIASILALLLTGSLSVGCSRDMLGGAAVGAVGAGAAYEYQHKKQMDRLEDDFKAGRIDREEYLKRKEDIESGSLIY